MQLHKVEDGNLGPLLEPAGHAEPQGVEVSEVEARAYLPAETVAEVDSHLLEGDLEQHVDVRREDVGLFGEDRAVALEKDAVDGPEEARVRGEDCLGLGRAVDHLEVRGQDLLEEVGLDRSANDLLGFLTTAGVDKISECVFDVAKEPEEGAGCTSADQEVEV